jgi:hypothetical protein
MCSLRTILAACVATLLALAAPAAASAAVRRVDVGAGSDAGSCGAVASPCASIQRAVNLSQSGDEILVAEGVYTHQAVADPCSSSDTGVVCIFNKQLTIRGGFAGGDWSSADPAAHPTVIDGTQSHRGVLVSRTFPGAPATSLVLDGFTIRDGRAFGGLGPPDADSGRGGGLKAALVDRLVVRDVTFLDNRAIGAATASAGGAALGGGLFVDTTPTLPSTVRLERVRFEANQALGGTGADRGGLGHGGGLLVSRASFVAFDVDLVGNLAAAGGSPGAGVAGGLRADGLGGGLALANVASAQIERLTATDNVASGGAASGADGVGGGAFGGGVYLEGSSLTMSDSALRGNQALAGDAGSGGLGAGGGLMAFDASLDLRRSTLIANRAEGGDGPTLKGSVGGGGAYLERAANPGVEVSLTNCVVADNFAQLGSGGGVVGGGGGGLFILGNDALLQHVTLARNGLSESPLIGQAVVVVNRLSQVSAAVIEHSIVSDHDSLVNNAAVHVQPQAFAHFERPLFADNTRNTNDGFGNHGTITGLDTAVLAADAGYVSPGPPDFDYHLTLASAAVDEAPDSEVVFDLDGSRRGDPRDIGADEICQAAADDVVLADATLSGAALVEACETITVRNYTVAASGDLTLRADRRVTFESGFQVLSGGRLRVDSTLP